MKSRRSQFEDVIFEVHKTDSNYNEVKHQILRAYDIFSKDVKQFKRMAIVTQYWLCHTACLMSLGASFRQLRTVEVFTTNKPVKNIEKNYSIEFGYKEPELLNIENRKLLL